MHLSISAAEWRTFLQIADDTFERKHVPMHARRDLREILAGFQQQCVLPAGRPAPPDPGAPRPHPSTLGTTFHRLGGVYPIAQFADRLVDALAAPAGPGADIGVKLEPVDDPASTRHPPGLKYLLTEMLCSAAGGKEVVTARGFEEAKLGVPAANWPAFCALATQHAAIPTRSTTPSSRRSSPPTRNSGPPLPSRDTAPRYSIPRRPSARPRSRRCAPPPPSRTSRSTSSPPLSWRRIAIRDAPSGYWRRWRPPVPPKPGEE